MPDTSSQVLLLHFVKNKIILMRSLSIRYQAQFEFCLAAVAEEIAAILSSLSN